jgi:SAM-dependent methyltransferase
MNARYTQVKACRICGNPELDPVFHLGTQHLTGIFPRTAESQRTLTQGPLELVKCRPGARGEHCGLLQLRHSFSPPEMYGANYGYRSSLNRSMVEHLQAKVRRIAARVALRAGDFVLDIGSNDGTLLGSYAQPGLKLIGIDPTSEKFRRYYPPNVTLVTDFFSAKNFRAAAGAAQAKVVTSIAMFYDLESPMDFVREVQEILAPDGIWVFEQSYMPAMLRTGSYDTICHEHLEYYALSQIKWMLDRAGMRIVDIELNDVNGGSFSVTAAKSGAGAASDDAAAARILAEEKAAGLDGMRPYEAFRDRAARHREALTEFIRGINARGQKIFGYGASTKGNVILQYCGLTSRDLPCIAEVNEDKFGAFTPGTAIPIVSEREARERKPDYLLVLPWHFRDNIVQREQAYLRGGGKLVFPLPEIEVVGAPG